MLAGIRVIDALIREMGWQHDEMGSAFRWEHAKTPDLRSKDHYRFYAVRFDIAWNQSTGRISTVIPTHLIAVEVHKDPTDRINPNHYYAEAEVWRIQSHKIGIVGEQPKILRSCWYGCSSIKPYQQVNMDHYPKTGRLLPSNYWDTMRELRPNRLV